LSLGGMTLYRRPMAFALQLARNKIKNLTLFNLTSSIESDLLVGAGCVKRIRTCYFGMEFLGLAPNFRRAAESQKIKIFEETELTIALALQAALMDVPFLPTGKLFNTDILKVREDLEIFKSPIGDEKLIAVRAVRPDVAVIHVPVCSEEGYAQIPGNLGVDKELSRCAKKVILTTEKIVSTKELSKKRVEIFGFNVDCVVELEKGAHPTSCYPLYALDLHALLAYMYFSSEEQFFESFLKEYVLGVESHREYLEKISKVQKMVEGFR
ncbi:MAG: CoA transferase subunit A, partial [Candidatus Methanofastidiosia archaeon]